MTPTEFFQLEQKRIELERGYFLTPIRVAELTKLSNQIVKLLATGTHPLLSFSECRYVLDITRAALDMACEEEKEKSPSGGNLTGKKE